MTRTSRTMVGRDAELAELAALLGVHPPAGRPERPGRAGRPERTSGVVLLSGDAGVGKTRLLTELRDLAVAEGWQVSAGHCLDFGDSALPYLPFSEVLGRLAATLPQVVEQVGTTHPALARLQPGRRVLDSAAPADGSDPEQDPAAPGRGELFDAVHALLEAAAQQAPLLLVIEDTHWADRSTRDLLSFLFARSFLGPVSIVVSYRSDDLHRRHPLRAQVATWSRLREVDRVALSPLPDDAVRALIAELVPDGLPGRELAALVDSIVARAEGNAFFVEELTSAASGPDSWVPADLADVLLVRLDRLDDTTRQVVRAASVSGRRVAHSMLAAATGLDPDVLEEGLRRAVEMNVLVADRGRYAFRHALLGEAVYDDLLPGERVRLHARCTAALSAGAASGTAAELARHARLSMDLDTALSASVRAGREAMAVGGPAEAAYHFQQALELAVEPSRSAGTDLDVSRLVVHAAEALTASGNPERAVEMIREQRARMPEATDEQRARMLAAEANSLYIIEGGRDPSEVSAEAVALAPEGDSPLRARTLAVHARVLASRGRYAEAETVGLDALALAERLNLPDHVSDAVTTLSGLKKAGSVEGLRAALADAVEQAERTGTIAAELRGRFLMGRSYQDWGDLDAAEEWFGSALDRATAAGLTWGPYGFEPRWQLALVAHVRGDWDRVLELTRVDEPHAPPLLAAILRAVRLTVEQGRGADVTAAARTLRPFWERDGAVAIHAAPVEMQDAVGRGDAAAVLAAYDDAVVRLTRIWHEWFSARVRLAAAALGALADLAPRASAAEREEYAARAERLHADGRTVVERYSDPSGHWGPEGRAWVKRLEAETLRVRWLAGVDAPAQEALVAAWQEAVAAFEELGHLHETARSRVVLAGILRAGGDLAGSRAQADLAREAARRLGAQPLLDLLRTLGSTPTRADVAADTLTVRETEILGLVAQGRSNGEIGKQLFISAKTVSVHVSNILGKLGAAGRTEAAAIGRRRGLVD